MIKPQTNAIVANSGLSSCMYGARKNISAPKIISANPELPFRLLCSSCAMFYHKCLLIACATFFFPMSSMNGPSFGPLGPAMIIR